MRKVFIAQDRRTGFHSVIEVLPSSYKFEFRDGIDSDLFNKLCQWKNLTELFSVLEETGPLVGESIYKKENRVISIDDAIDMFQGSGFFPRPTYTENDLDFLHMQLYLDNKKGFYPSKASVSRAVKEFGLFESSGIDELVKWKNEDWGCRIVIEPLHDFVVMRNFCSVILRLIANYQDPSIENPVEESGFVRINRSRKWWVQNDLLDSYYVIPIRHNPAVDRTITFSTKWFKNVYSYEMTYPLYSAIFKTRPKSWKRGMGCIECADTLSSPTVTGKGFPFFPTKRDYDTLDSRCYLGLRDDIPQKEIIETFIKEFGEMFENLKCDPIGNNASRTLIGWEEQIPSPGENVSCSRVYKTLAGAMVGSLLYRADTIPVACRNCGKGMLVKNKGKRKEFCSASCRAQYYAAESETK